MKTDRRLILFAMPLIILVLSATSFTRSDKIKTYTLQEIALNSRLILVNKNNKLPAGYSPKGLVKTNAVVKTNFSDTMLLPETLSALVEMFDAAKKDKLELILFAGYRSEATQALFYSRAGAGNNRVAPPRTSEHETGYAADILSVDYMIRNANFGESKAGKWLVNNCYKYGFILRYPRDKTRITQYMYEPWHYRYLGKEAAGKVSKSGLCYEEYVKKYGLPVTD